jgi:hypothetical protein
MRLMLAGLTYVCGVTLLLSPYAFGDLGYRKCGSKSNQTIGCDDVLVGSCTVTTWTPAQPACVKSTSIDDCIWHDDPSDSSYQLLETTATVEKGDCFDGECFNLTPQSEDIVYFFPCSGT